MSILCKTPSIRDVIAFPKTGTGTDLLFESPAPARPDVLDQYGIGEAGVMKNLNDRGGAKFGARTSTNTGGGRCTGTTKVETEVGSTFGAQLHGD